MNKSQLKVKFIKPQKMSNQVNIQSSITNQPSQLSSSRASYLGKSFSQPKLRTCVHEHIFQNTLSNQLSEQIAMKQQLRRNQKLYRLELQKQLIKRNDDVHSNERNKERNFLKNYTFEALNSREQKQIKKLYQNQHRQVEKMVIDRQYKQNSEVIEKRRLGIDEYNSSLDQLHNVRKSSLPTLNPENNGFMTKSTHYKISNEELQEQKNQYRQTLLEQMRQKSQTRMDEKEATRSRQFVDQKYRLLINNPITNPVNVKVARDNPHAVKDWMRRNDMQMIKRMNNDNREPTPVDKLSYLSRRGSSSLLNYGY